MLSVFLMALQLAVMNVSFQPQIASPAVGPDRASRRNRLSNKTVQARAGRIRYRTQTNASDALSILFGGDDNQCLFLRPPADCAGFLSSPVGLVHLDNAIQPVAAGSNHGAAQFMQHPPRPSCSCPSREHAVNPRRSAVTDISYRQWPQSQWVLRIAQASAPAHRGQAHPPGQRNAARYSTQASSVQKRRSSSSSVFG